MGGVGAKRSESVQGPPDTEAAKPIAPRFAKPDGMRWNGSVRFAAAVSASQIHQEINHA